jgi:hypothetical protein
MTDQLTAEAPGGYSTAADDVVLSLRGVSSRRPQIDPGLAGGLRDWLEDGLCSLSFDAEAPLVVTKHLLRDARAGHAGRPDPTKQATTSAMALGALIDAIFRQFVTIGHIDDPLQDGLDALKIDPRRSEIVDFVYGLTGQELVTFRDELESQTGVIASRWPQLSPAWLPRTQERIAVPLAGGGVILVGVIDLILGAPSTGRASVGIVEVKSGRARIEDRDDLRFYALLETLRSGAQPFRIGTFYTRTGQFDGEDVDDELLASCVQRIIAALFRAVGSR